MLPHWAWNIKEWPDAEDCFHVARESVADLRKCLSRSLAAVGMRLDMTLMTEDFAVGESIEAADALGRFVVELRDGQRGRAAAPPPDVTMILPLAFAVAAGPEERALFDLARKHHAWAFLSRRWIVLL